MIQNTSCGSDHELKSYSKAIRTNLSGVIISALSKRKIKSPSLHHIKYTPLLHLTSQITSNQPEGNCTAFNQGRTAVVSGEVAVPLLQNLHIFRWLFQVKWFYSMI